MMATHDDDIIESNINEISNGDLKIAQQYDERGEDDFDFGDRFDLDIVSDDFGF